MQNFDSELPPFQLTFLTMTTYCCSTFQCLPKHPKWLQNRLHTEADGLYCPPSSMNLCRVKVTRRALSTSETALLFNPLKFAEFHNHSPLLTMIYIYSNNIAEIETVFFKCYYFTGNVCHIYQGHPQRIW